MMDCQSSLLVSQQQSQHQQQHQQSMSNLTLDWLAANAGLFYGQQAAAAAAAAAAAVAANQRNSSQPAGSSANQRHYSHQLSGQQHHQDSSGGCSMGLFEGRELNKHQYLGQGGQQSQQLDESSPGGQQRVVSPGFVQPIHHHVVMSPNTIASAAFAGKSPSQAPSGSKMQL